MSLISVPQLYPVRSCHTKYIRIYIFEVQPVTSGGDFCIGGHEVDTATLPPAPPLPPLPPPTPLPPYLWRANLGLSRYGPVLRVGAVQEIFVLGSDRSKVEHRLELLVLSLFWRGVEGGGVV